MEGTKIQIQMVSRNLCPTHPAVEADIVLTDEHASPDMCLVVRSPQCGLGAAI